MASVNNIEALRLARGWKRPELARRMDTTAQQVERLEKSQRRLTTVWIDRAAAAFGVSPADIITAGSEPAGPLPDTIDKAPDLPVLRSQGSVLLKQIDLGFSMGDGSNIDDYIESSELEFDATLLASLTRSPVDRLFVARGDGDSMFPTLVNEDMVIVDTLQRRLNLIDRIWAISLYGAGGIKRLRALAEGKVEVISDNAAHTNQVVDAADVRILGRVIWVGRRV